MHPSADSNPWIALLTLTAMEILLGVDNVDSRMTSLKRRS